MNKKTFKKVIGVIPARMQSRRYPGKVLAPIRGIPMVARVYFQTKQATLLNSVFVATDSSKVYHKMTSLDIPVVMTASSHRSGTDRVAEVARREKGDIYVNIQGDEPLIDPGMIDELIHPFLHNDTLKMGTAATTSISQEEFQNPDVVKVEIDDNYFATNFFRTPSPNDFPQGVYKHIGIYIYRREFLIEFSQMPRSHHEIEWKLEQFRALDRGIPIKVVITHTPSFAVDTIEDLKKVEKRLVNA